ncbi:hypothetical protein OQI_14495 [Streptomyces pharetrae CZA14]|uniref:Uncharacterized protein n=1 Tax=Streptomyces pharetrae CZA14 TaxID=1144883 RepID=A0ABX3YKN6_9ACTN|nr:hypothetical protein OQI_14495 [Streptomyces pharetrae CZA14]
MTDRDTGSWRMLAGLLADSHLTPFELLPARITAHARAAGLGDVRIYLGDLQRRVLRLLTGGGPGADHDDEPPEPELTVEGWWPGGRTSTASSCP